ncbi:glyoxylate/hydroxypyruvate reductase A [Polaribacter reichenbachii]|uniref:Glyoxylate/hydroxypyruvate reductase A n=1 Tax=Polaribacter reichenbachii TaxID=996801 RepID=A0A1B8U2C7_9FLAO|nr:glyoxylate/hydroxypyruvate reductase A [Polaribacter reichenbachii]APZ47719.1 glyoxylate/hydroxypyruvate reductase A [Polaribacter reichenbachii]AUC18353.1 glyoxylate/hydroxypyruvate reductase A [Polaribacter reichenbachii]OBY66037.1 glyoxylate/hydroxypyruvate reductase A [Polaribacter reichenbachii]
MSILLIFENKDVNPWKKELETKLPNETIEVYPNVKNNKNVEFVICWKPKKHILKKIPNIKVIHSVGASIDHIINSQTVKKDQIITRIVDEKLSDDMWEFLLTIVLSELKNMNRYAAQQNQKLWQQLAYRSINNTTVSILGLGKIGSYVAQKFAQIGFNVKGWSNSAKQIENVTSFSGENEFNLCLNNSDFLINLLPLTPKTKGILNTKTFQQLPKNAFIINVGRGEHLITKDLIHQLNNDTLSGAFLDVFNKEPLPKEHPFWQHSKIQISPHIASLTNVKTATNQIIENYKRFLNNEHLLNVVSLKKGY